MILDVFIELDLYFGLQLIFSEGDLWCLCLLLCRLLLIPLLILPVVLVGLEVGSRLVSSLALALRVTTIFVVSCAIAATIGVS